MNSQDKAPGVKSAYEAALERLELRGIAKPRLDALSESVRQEMEEVRSRASAEIAQLEIMHRQKLASLEEPLLLRQEEEDFLRERSRIEERKADRIEALRNPSQ